MNPGSFFSSRHRQGAALVVVLAFIVLLTGVVVAYFTRATTSRKLSDSSLYQTQSSQLAYTAADIVIGDLLQEIVDGSDATSVGSGTTTIYRPTSPANMLPQRNVSYTGADPFPNLVRVSKRSDTLVSPAIPSRASASNSSSDVSMKGRNITPSRWNSHYLVPRKDESDATIDTSPVDAFGVAANNNLPDWVYVTGTQGPEVITAPDKEVIGRYAYAIYDEGGLLDVNAAGAPSGLTSQETADRISVALADLTQIPTTAPDANMTQAQIDNLIGWRNYATVQPAGNFANFTFDSAAASRYLNFVKSQDDGFLVTSGTSFNGKTDQMFISRQMLLEFQRTTGFSQNALQYLTHFSRALEQPSYFPHPDRPRIIETGTPPPVATQADSYRGNNDAVGGDDLINVAFLSVRVKNSFTRANGATAAVGEPLVKTRFPLNRLELVTPSAVSSTDIMNYFGLSRSNSSAPWVYNHGSNSILTLDQVADANREPDFAELLKAAILVGSLAKGGPNLKNWEGNYQYTLDTSVDYQVLQIMANLIDQYDADSYPTQIQIAAGSVDRVFRGTEDLPYFYRYHPFSVVTRLPSPLLSKTQTVNFQDGSNAGAGATVLRATVSPVTGLTDPGEVAMLYIPEVWNPHDPNTTLSTSMDRPTRFKIVAVTADPALPVPQTPAWEIGTDLRVQGANTTILPTIARPRSSLAPLNETNTEILFSDNAGRLFREPTLLWRTDAPANSNIALGAGNALGGPISDINTGVSYVGVLLGRSPVSTRIAVAHPATPQAADNFYLLQGYAAGPYASVPVGGYQQITFRLKYLDAAGNWITYDEKYPDLHGLSTSEFAVNTADFPNEAWKNPFRTNGFRSTATSYDPRTARFGVGTESTWGANSPADNPTLEIDTGNFGANSAAANAFVGSSKFTVLQTQRPRPDRGNYVRYSNPGMTSDPGKNQQMRLFDGVGFSASNGQNAAPFLYDGLWTQNNPAVTTTSRAGGIPVKFYYEDPDGVARRAMGAYAATSLLSTASPVGLPQVTANTYTVGGSGVGTATSQSQSRPLILNRPFQSVSEMSSAFKGSLWKQIDFFTPESGDTALLDVFCINEPPADGLVAGKVNLNTRQVPVLKAILSGAYRDELKRHSGAPSYALNALSPDVAELAAQALVDITSDTVAGWRGPLTNLSEIVGRYVPTAGDTTGATDLYQFNETITNTTYSYAGFSAALDDAVYTDSPLASPAIQRFRETAIRPLVNCGQVRVWNLLIDVIAQSGKFPSSANTLSQFVIEGEKRYWVHVAIDRDTGTVIDLHFEMVTE